MYEYKLSKKTKIGYIYLLSTKKGLIKYGYTKNNVKKRLRYWIKKTSEDFQIVYVAKCKYPSIVENDIKWFNAAKHATCFLDQSFEFSSLDKRVLVDFIESNKFYVSEVKL